MNILVTKYSEGWENSNNEFTSEEQSLLNDDFVICYLPNISLEWWIALSALSITDKHLWLLPFCMEKFPWLRIKLCSHEALIHVELCIKTSQWICNIYRWLQYQCTVPLMDIMSISVMISGHTVIISQILLSRNSWHDL